MFFNLQLYYFYDIFVLGDNMAKDKREAVELVVKKMNNDSFLSYIEIAEITGYHPKYILKLKKDIINGNISFEHGNKNKKPANSLSDDEKKKIISLYKRSHTSIRKFCKFYARRSYSCIYNVIKEYEESINK